MSSSERDAIEMMERCHGKLSERARRLVDLAVEGAGAAEEIDATIAFFERVTARHFADEEESIFPRLGDEQAALVARLLEEHREHEGLLEELRRAARGDGELGGAAARWAEELTAHAELEDEALLPLMRRMDAPTIDAITAEMKARRGGQPGRGRGGGGGGDGRGGGGGRNRRR